MITGTIYDLTPGIEKMTAPSSTRKPKASTGNGRDLPHMQSSLSPQGFGLYNSIGGGGCYDGGGDAPSSLANRGPRNNQPFKYNDYPMASPINSVKQYEPNTSPALAGGGDGRGWRNPTGNENLANHNNFGGGGGGNGGGAGSGSYLNATSAPSFDSSKAIRNLPPPPPSSFPEMGPRPEQSPLYKKIGERLASTGNGKAIMGAGTPTTMRSGRIIPGSVEMDRDRKKDRLIESLSQSDMITCLPGFKKRPTQFPAQRKSWPPPNDQIAHRIAQQGLSPNMMDYQTAPSPTVEGSPMGPASSSYARQAPAPFSPAPNYNRDKFTHEDGGREARKGVGGYEETGRFINSDRNPNSFGGGNPIRGSNNNTRPIPPSSPITRAKAAVGQAQSEILKMNSIAEEDRDRQKPHGSWKNMGTPFFYGTEPLLKSVERQQKVQYRMDLERQIMASKMRKAEQQRREKEGTDHPLGPEYAHPALTYYNPPQKIMNSGSTAANNPTVTAALTKYMKEKYAIGNPPLSARSTGVPSSPRGTGGGSGEVAGRMGPLQQQAQMGKVSGNSSNLMKGGMQVGDENQGMANRFPPQQQNPPQQQQPFVQGNMPGRSFNQQYQGPAQATPQYGYPAGMLQQQHPSRQYGYGAMNMNPWQMYQHPAYAQYYGQFAGAANPGSANPQQQQALAAAQYYQQQQNYGPTVPHSASSPTPSPFPSPRSRRMEEHQMNNEGFGGGDAETGDNDELDRDFEALKEKAYRSQKIWQTSDELPDPSIRTAVYKAELRKQIDEDRRRKAERQDREKREDERIEMKIKEFQEEERRRMMEEERTRAELEEYESKTKTQQRTHRRKNEAFTISQNPCPGRQRHVEPKVRRRRQHPRPRMMEEPHPRVMGAGDFEEQWPPEDPGHLNNHQNYFSNQMMEDQDFGECHMDNEKEEFVPPSPPPMFDAPNHAQPVLRTGSPPVPVVQRKLMMEKGHKFDNWNPNHMAVPTSRKNPKQTPTAVRSCRSQSFFNQLKGRLKSEKDLLERRLHEKVVSTHKNLNLLKYTLNHD